MENTTGTNYKAYDNALTQLKTSTFTGRKTYGGKPTKSYLAHIKANPDENNPVPGKVYNTATKRFVNADQFYDKRAKTKTLKKSNKVDIVNGKLTNKQIQCIGIALNTSNCQSEASDHKDRLSKEYGLPCLDPLQDSLDPFIQIIEKI